MRHTHSVIDLGLLTTMWAGTFIICIGVAFIVYVLLTIVCSLIRKEPKQL